MTAQNWKKIILSNAQFDECISKLVELIRPNKDKYNFIYGIPRGGLIVGVWLSHQLGIDYVTDADLEVLGPKDKILIVDDIADTGITLEKYDWLVSDTATLHYKPRSIRKPTYYAQETNDWIVYPWERLDEEPNREV